MDTPVMKTILPMALLGSLLASASGCGGGEPTKKTQEPVVPNANPTPVPGKSSPSVQPSVTPKDTPKTKAPADDPASVKKEVQDILSGKKTSSADTIEERRKRMAGLSKEILDDWAKATNSTREDVLPLLMNYDRLYENGVFQKGESDRLRKLYSEAK